MADQIDYRLEGDDFQAVVITLDPGEAVRAEPGAMMYMETGVEMATSTGGGLEAGAPSPTWVDVDGVVFVSARAAGPSRTERNTRRRPRPTAGASGT